MARLAAIALLAGCADPPDAAMPLAVDSATQQDTAGQASKAEYVGSAACSGCHQTEHELWLGSHHQQAMQIPSAETVLAPFDGETYTHGDLTSQFKQSAQGFIVRTDNEAGDLAEFSVRYTFGVAPLQQYLLATSRGRLQALGLAWDAQTGGWFHLQPDEVVDHTDVLHWTGTGATWNHICADCHSTAVRKNYDAASRSYKTTFAEVSVGCEACHGPGSGHLNRVQPGGSSEAAADVYPLQTPARQLAACAPCHSRRSQLAEGYTPGESLLDYYQPALLDAGLYHPDGQIEDEVFVYGSFLQSRMYAQGVSCSDCHNPHSGQLHEQDNRLCVQCHNRAGRAEFPTLQLKNYDDPGHHHHPSDSAGAMCRNCHMPETTYMVIDHRADHSFRVPRPDLTVSLGVPNACSGCHTDQSAAWAARAVAQWYGSPPAPLFASTFAAAREGDANAEAELVAIAQNPGQPAIVRATALSLLQGYAQYLSSSVIEQSLGDADPLVRIGALRGATRWPAQQRWRLTRTLLDDVHLAVRITAVNGLLDALQALTPSDQKVLRVHLQRYLQTMAYAADTAEGQLNMANVHMALGAPAAAEAALAESLRINPQWVPALINLTDLLRATGRDAEAGPLLARALSAAPEQPQVLLSAALWRVRQGQYPAALALLARGRAAAPADEEITYVYMVALNSDGQAALALETADRFLADNPAAAAHRVLPLAFSIARDAAMVEKMQAYQQRLQ